MNVAWSIVTETIPMLLLFALGYFRLTWGAIFNSAPRGTTFPHRLLIITNRMGNVKRIFWKKEKTFDVPRLA
jgi:cytochrome b